MKDSADNVILRNLGLAVGIRSLVLTYARDTSRLTAEMKAEVNEMAQLPFMEDLRYQTNIHLLGEIVIMKLSEKGLEARNDPNFRDAWDILHQHRLLIIPIPDRRIFLGRVLHKISMTLYETTHEKATPISSMPNTRILDPQQAGII